ncbi:hypothetical protein E9531_15925 [Lampropedia puyangensis]|uniref:Uncharacterized protein n=1 Tax=Lampropedia puyangensis TaxID=1330072 RepID=A0A4V4GQE2_9BURK|nr:hypothetical protein [Lampropedia puyangensis]THT97465.1 hypothetical protein E9531_15925 [Lampropedia puyangensis]
MTTNQVQPPLHPWSPRPLDTQTLRVSRILQTTQLVTGLVFIPVLFMLCQRLPVQAGWENGFFEILQNVVLGFSAAISLVLFALRRSHVQRSLWLGVALIWLLMLGRELSWGAVFLEPLSMDAISGPYFSSHVLPYRPAIPAIGFGLLAIALLLVYRAKLGPMLQYAWSRKALMPWAYGLCMLICATLGTAAEGKLGSFGHAWKNAQVIEEGFEFLTYYFLLRAQIWTYSRWLKV